MARMFKNDYSELAHPRILEALKKYSLEQNIPYGLDYHSENASNLIKKIFNAENADVHYLAGGTQSNMVFISAALRPYEGVIACASGHINVHETAAIEGSGHKIYCLEGKNGKLYPEDIKLALKNNYDEHMVKLKLVYISNSTEIGTIYSKKELIDLHNVCKENDLYLFIDGARLGSALTCKENDVDSSLLGSICDGFYVGGTKNGLLFGEALVILNDNIKKDFRYHIKNKGAMLAKGYGLGIQFEEAFKDGLYFELAKHANEMAESIRNILKKFNINLLDAPTNQIFASLPKCKANALIDKFGLEKWSEKDESMTVRFVTSFATTNEDVDCLNDYLEELFD